MSKGKYGIALPAVAVLAFVLAYFGSWQSIILLIAFAVLLEKEEFLGKQTVAALVLSLLVFIVEFVIGKLFGVWRFCAEKIADLADKFYIYNPRVENVILWIVGVLSLVFTIIGIIQVAKRKEVKLPIVTSVTNWAFGIVVPKPVYQQQYQQPVYQQPVQPNPQPDVQSGACPNCGAPVEGKFCGKCGSNIQ